MKAVPIVLLLAVSASVMCAQSATPTGDVTIRMSAGSPEYCLGSASTGGAIGGILKAQGFFKAQSPDDITLRLPLKFQYANHRPETILLPPEIGFLTRMTVAGQNGTTTLRSSTRSDVVDVTAVMAASQPSQSPFFSTIAGRKAGSSPARDLLQCISAADRDCISDTVVIPVLDHSSGLDLRGKTVQIVMTRDYRSLAPDVVQKLNEKWKNYGTVWTGVVESEMVTFRIADTPLTQNCSTSRGSPR